MAQIQQRVLIACALALSLTSLQARKFYDDDPLEAIPKPLNVGKLKRRKASEIYDYFYYTFGRPGEKSTRKQPVPAQAINTLGEVPDSDWYTNRHARKRMTLEELVRGPGNSQPPSMDAPWNVTAAKTEGVTPGFTIKDSRGHRYQVKFDVGANFEQGTGADVMGSKFFYALGYFTPQNYIAYFTLNQLHVAPGAKFVDNRGEERDISQGDIEQVMATVPRDKEGRFRAIASGYLEGEPIGPFRYDAVRRDDPNDVVLHEHRRDLRGLRVFDSWLSHTDAKDLNSLDMIVTTNGIRHVRHNLIDFSAAFGAEAFEPKSPRAGYVYLLDWKDSARQFFSFGLAVPAWARAHYEYFNQVGRMESRAFNPEHWKPNYYIPAFDNCMPDDAYWAAKIVMTFTEPEIRALVSTAQYSSKEGAEYLVKILVERQQKIGRVWFSKVLPLDEFRVDNGQLKFEDLGVRYGFSQPRSFSWAWSVFDNETERRTAIDGAASASVPTSGAAYLAAEITGGDPDTTVTVYLRQRDGKFSIAGIERGWHGRPHSAEDNVSRASRR